ncbi:MAG: hypothetical protein M3281_07495 [Chloroflexota bacterium]|nr:hypothetical protein [Chloroflexota bacterium]
MPAFRAAVHRRTGEKGLGQLPRLLFLSILGLLAFQACSRSSQPAAARDAELMRFDRLRGDYRMDDGRVLYFGRFGPRPLFYQDGDVVTFIRPLSGTRYEVEGGGVVEFQTDASGQGTAVSLMRRGVPESTGRRVQLYRKEEVRFSNGEARLSGTLLVPHGRGPFPAVVFIHGSGKVRRENLENFADRFAREGIASLVYDKRERYSETVGRRSYDDLAGDALAAVELLKGRSEIAPGLIGVWGISEGGWVGPLAASRSPDVAFVIPVSASGVIPLRQEVWLEENNLRHGGVSGKVVDTVVKAWKLVADAGRLPLPKGFRENIYLLSDAHYDPVPTLQRVKQPVLAIYGAVDKVVPPAESARIIASILDGAGHSGYTIRFFAHADHSLLLSRDGYGFPSQHEVRFAPGYIDEMIRWVKALAAGNAQRGEGIVGELPVQERPTRDVLSVSWYGSAWVQCSLLLLFLIAFAVCLVTSRHRDLGRKPGMPRWLSRLTRALSILRLVVLLGFFAFLVAVLLFAGKGLDQVGGRPVPWIVLEALATLTAALTVALLGSMILMPGKGRLGRSERARLGTLAVTAVLFLPWMLYWNLLPVGSG